MCLKSSLYTIFVIFLLLQEWQKFVKRMVQTRCAISSYNCRSYEQNLDMRGMCSLKLTCLTVKAENYYLYSLGQIRMKLTAVVQLQRGINQIPEVRPRWWCHSQCVRYFQLWWEAWWSSNFRNFQNLGCCCEKSTSEDYVCNQFKRLSFPPQVLPLNIVEKENSHL